MTNSQHTILALPSWYPSELDAFNGDFIQRHIQAIALHCRQYVIYVVKDEKGSVTKDISTVVNERENYTEKIIYYHSPASGIGFIDRFLSHQTYKRILKRSIAQYVSQQGKPTLVHVHVAMKAGIGALWAKHKYGVPYIITENWTGYYRQSVPNIHGQNIFLKRALASVIKEAKRVVPVSNDLAGRIKENFGEIKYQVIPNVVNRDIFFYDPKDVPRFRFIHPSYLSYQKNPDGMLEACKILKQRGYSFELLFLGSTDQRLTEKARLMGLLDETVFFKPLLPYTEVAKQMQDSSALLMFSRFENLPCVILEALCCGLPVISSRVGGIAEVIDERNGILVESENVDQLADAMQQLVDNHALYNGQTISSDAIARFNYDTVGAQYRSLYKEISS